MAILKHIASKSSSYGAALEYLIFKHDELRKTPILDQNGNRIMRDEFYLDGLNCEPYSFDAACQQLNREYQKNKNKRIPISEKLLEEIVRNALTAQIKQAEHILEVLHERERKALIRFSALERQEEKLSAEKAEIVKQRVALYEQYADGNISKEEFIRQRDAYRVQEDERMEQIQRLRTEKNQIFQPVKKDADNLQAVMDTVGEAGDVMYLSQNVVETFIDRIEVFNDEHVKIRFTFEDALNSYEEK